ncbi:FliO/MopB family protein [Leptothrix discophora]|uniref:Flagellar biosynthetic protein FliO n=1 Tax=Leptothrix discophora TaxID=89 RepID=A0ABT9G6E6_LEPDI|nr:flagellar biosynthetic protein FliO [Leptothrix discophora]MDP4302056.1 flagellar biosynthetic protein FliO [Leptothrix discophora]
MTSSWTALLWLIVVVAAIPAALWLLKRSGMAGRLGGGAAGIGLKQVGALALGPQQRVVAVEVGSGEARRWLLLGVTPQQVSTLHVMDAWPGPAPGEAGKADAAVPAGSFGVELARRLHGAAGRGGDHV